MSRVYHSSETTVRVARAVDPLLLGAAVVGLVLLGLYRLHGVEVTEDGLIRGAVRLGFAGYALVVVAGAALAWRRASQWLARLNAHAL